MAYTVKIKGGTDLQLENGPAVSAGAPQNLPNFAGLNLTNADFSGRNLRGANFTGATINGADFSYADLRGALLTSTVWTLQAPNFTGATLGV